MMMKMKTSLACLLVGIGGLFYAGFAAAQACGALTGTASTTAVGGNNCNNNLNFTKICANSETLGGGGMDIYSFDLGAGYSGVSVTISTTAFTPELGVIAATCSSSTTCVVDQTVAAAGDVSGTLPTGLTAGTYYIFVANVTDAACGAYNVSLAGTLPVKLQNFSVQ
jgi:hypothetical protein